MCNIICWEALLGQKPHERAQNINLYLDEVRGWVRSLWAADAGRPRPRSGLLVDWQFSSERAPVRAADVGRRSPDPRWTIIVINRTDE